MSSSDKYYLIFRRSDDRHGGIENLYGWTANKSILNAFLKQRSKNKYMVERMELNGSEIEYCSNRKMLSTEYLDLRSELMIDILELKSCQSGTIVKFFTTEEEKQRIERDIKVMFDELRSFDRIDDERIINLVNLYNKLDEKYMDALEYIGYRPKEISYLYDKVDDMYGDDREVGIDCIGFDSEDGCHITSDEYSNDPSKVIIYSLESVIKVLKDDL